ncbi:MAG: hypothetical protein EBT03_07405 [Betaproteobacteria bacterium]|nr:hypothetical protein [Betaproteobacteria bacterium]NCA16998.1 hypothetical protein [Betaproteobacteria bacterium]
MFKEATDHSFNLDRHLVKLLSDSPFFAEISRHVHKVITRDLPTAGVTYDRFTGDFVMGVNPDFFGGLTDAEISGVLRHEYYHIVFLHVTNRRKAASLHRRWNVATDLAINSIILDSASGQLALPDSALVPGRPLKLGPGKENAAGQKVSDLIEKFPALESSDFYFNRLSELAEELKDECPVHGKGAPGEGEGSEGDHSHGDSEKECTCGGVSTLDDHDTWDEVPDEVREEAENKARSLVEKAAREADSKSNGWGNMPQSIRDDIRRMVSQVVDWRGVLRQFVGSIARGGRSTTIRRINRKYPYVHPGVKRGYVAKLAVAVDQSGSVSNEMLGEFFSELERLTRKASVTIIPFDHDVDPSDVFEWRKGTRPALKRTKSGGTSFQAPTDYVNSPRNRGRWDGVIFLTDGECAQPSGSRVKRGWILGKGCRLLFETDEMQVSMDPGTPPAGSWR